METRSEIRAILFDNSGVMARPRQKMKQLRAQIERDFGVSKKDLKRELEARGLYDLSSKQLANIIHIPLKEAFGVNLPAGWADARVSSDLCERHVELVRALRREYRTAIVANSDGTVEQRITDLGIRDLFDAVIDSEVVGVRKPEAGIFLTACARLGVAPRNCLFIDDKPENVRGAERLGMQGICFSFERGDDLEQLLAERGVRVLVAA